MSYPIPPDPRAAENFQLIRNFGAVDFEDHSVLNVAGSAVPNALALGEPVVYTGVNKTEPTVWQLGTTAGHIVGYNNDFKFAGWCWNKYGNDFEDYGSPSCLALGKVPIASKGKHRVRVLTSEYIALTPAAAGVRTAAAVTIGQDVVVMDMGAGNHARYAPLLPKATAVRTVVNPSTSRYLVTATDTQSDADEALNARIDEAIVGKIVVVDGDYCEIEFN
jgi:hypothetical protein